MSSYKLYKIQAKAYLAFDSAALSTTFAHAELSLSIAPMLGWQGLDIVKITEELIEFKAYSLQAARLAPLLYKYTHDESYRVISRLSQLPEGDERT